MMGFAMIGYLVVAVALGLGIYWMATNLTIKKQPDRYTYTKDEEGNEVVKDNTNEKTK